MNDQQRLEQLIRAGHTAIFIPTFEEAHALKLVRAAFDSTRAEQCWWSADEGVRKGFGDGAKVVPDTTNAAAALFHLRSIDWPFMAVFIDVAAHLGDPVTLRQFRALLSHAARLGGTVVLIDHATQLPPVLASYCTPFELSLPHEDEIERLVLDTLRRQKGSGELAIDIRKSQLKAFISNLRGLTRRQIERLVVETVAEDRKLTDDDLAAALTAKRHVLAADGVLEFVQAPASLDEVGGLQRLKRWLDLRKGVVGSEAQAFGLCEPRGVLMLGVQGAGKSLCAKAVATAWQRPLLRLDPGRLYDRYIGESERRLRECLDQAERMAPMVLWIDEIEKGFSSAASTSIDGGLSRRMFGTLLTWMQDHRAAVFLVATANDIDALPPELLRKGRFDEIFFVDLPDDAARRQIVSIHLRKRSRDPGTFDVAAIAAAAEGYSGAEIEQAIVAALYECFGQKRELCDDAILRTIQGSPPLSVTAAEKISKLRDWARQRTVPAD